ncbi:beta-galactosidase [Actinokineospora guangxiensis]|uniref:Beta-galactosidase n=1 Tax=Actinokineospora guangxiensis TaxID=1490288 RepID=A0ABW0EWV1_9PSEU
MVFEVIGDQFALDGEPFQILSGSMNYFRVVPEQWRARLDWAAHLGLNTVETYLPWAIHEPAPGEFRFTGAQDVVGYLRTAADAGLRVIARPGPYACAEIDFGGLPSWLLREDIAVRSTDPHFLGPVARWFDQVLPRLVPLQHDHGGPIIAMQVENEFGAVGREDPEYLDWLHTAMRERGVTVPLITSDQADAGMQARGGHPAALRTINFDTGARAALELLRAHQPTGPLMCTEFWNGWFDHWGEAHHRRDPADAAADLAHMLAAGASVNFYMFCGGTNFGFSNGANHDGRYQPTITSYDYDAPLSEHGTPTAKFALYRDVIAEHTGRTTGPPPALPPLLPETTVPMTPAMGWAQIRPALGKAVPLTAPAPMEELGQDYGFVSYEFTVAGPGRRHLDVPGVSDRAQVLVDGVEVAVLDREHGIYDAELVVPGATATVELIVENLGRVNYGEHLVDRKGVLGDILVDGRPVTDLLAIPMDWSALPDLPAGPVLKAGRGPVLHQGAFTVESPADSFVDTGGWTKGVVWVNGFCLGRYWDRGPQRRLYLPGPVLTAGSNTVAVLELHTTTAAAIVLRPEPDLG